MCPSPVRLVVRALVIAALLTATWGAAGVLAAEVPPRGQPPHSRFAWSLEEALGQLRLNPRDAYLQYVALQLARNEGRLPEVRNTIFELTGRWRRAEPPEVDLFSLFTGAAAVQESLQLEAMAPAEQGATISEPPMPGARSPQPPAIGQTRPPVPAGRVPVSRLKGPQVKSHPWARMWREQQMLRQSRGEEPTVDVSPLAMCVPEDQYYVVCRSLAKLLELSDAGDLWGAHLFTQAAGSARSYQTTRRLKEQLAVKTDPFSRPFYDLVVEEVAITGSDLALRAGSDVTLLFRLKQPAAFRLRMDGFLAEAARAHPDAQRTTGRIGQVEYVHLSTPDRTVHVYSAYPREDLHVRSNSLPAFRRVLQTIAGGDQTRPLGRTDEFRYIRTLMPRADRREDVFVYLSDPFIRRLVGPELRLSEYRRMVCYSYLRMIGHAAMLYRTQYGRQPDSLEQLAQAGCAPGVFGRGKWRCPCGGQYSLSEDGTTGVCSIHGPADRLRPCCEVPVEEVSAQEAELYRRFVDRYSRYWQRYFDPIAIRVQVTPEQFRAETLILPLIDNTAYTFLAALLGGEPEPLDSLPVPKSNIFSVVVRLNKEVLLSRETFAGDLVRELFDLRSAEIEGAPDRQSVEKFLSQGIGNQLGIHVCDASPMFDFNLTEFAGQLIVEARRGWLDEEIIPIAFLVGSLNTPVYLSVPVEDAQVVDEFLEQLDVLAAAAARQRQDMGFLDFGTDYYRVPLNEKEGAPLVRSFCLQFGPVRWRAFVARLGNGLYLASKRKVLEDLAAIAQQKPEDGGPVAHAMLRVRPENWNRILPHFQLGWAERSRQACLDNLSLLSAAARAELSALNRPGPMDGVTKVPPPQTVLERAERLHAIHFFCPDGGRYELSPDGSQVICSVHGSAAAPRQPAAPTPQSPMGRILRHFGGATAELIFLEDGLHAVVTIRRK